MNAAVLSHRARRDLLAAARWIEHDNPAAAEGLRAAIVLAAARIAAHPEIGRLRPELAEPPRRFLSLAGFPYVIVYNPRYDPPVILRILHGARDLGEALGAG